MNKGLVIALTVFAVVAVAAAFGGEAGYEVAIKHVPGKYGYGIGESVRYDKRVLHHGGLYGGYGLGGYGGRYGGYGLGGYGGLYGGYGLGGYGGLLY